MAFRLTVPVPLENDVHLACVRALQWFLLPPAEWACYPAGHLKLSAAEVARLTRMGLRRGWPDLLVVHRMIYGIEIKRPGGRLSVTRMGRTASGAPREYIGQDQMFPRLERAGMKIAVVTDPAEMLRALAGWGVPLRQHR